MMKKKMKFIKMNMKMKIMKMTNLRTMKMVNMKMMKTIEVKIMKMGMMQT